MNLKDKLLRQRRLPFIGGLLDVWTLTNVFLSMGTAFMMATMLYETVIKPYFGQEGATIVYLPWLRIHWFYLMGVVAILLAMVLVYKFLYPSYFAFRNKQEYEHQNLLREDLKDIKDRLGNIERRIKIDEQTQGTSPDEGGEDEQ